VAEQPHQEAHAEFRDDLEDVAVHRHVHQRHDEEQLGHRETRHAEKEDRQQRRGHHEQGIEDVVGGHHASTLLLGGTRLDQRIQRHDIEAAKQPEAHHAAQQRQATRLGQQAQPVIGAVRRCQLPGAGPQQNAEQAQADRTERHQTDLHLAARQPLAKHRAEADAQREQGKDQRHHTFIAMQPVLGKGRNLREIHRAEEPEPGVADQRARHRRTLPQPHAHDLPGLAEDIPVQCQLRQRGMGKGNEAAGQVAEHRHPHHTARHQRGIVAAGHEQASANGATKNRQEGAGFHQRIAAHQLVLAQCLGQD